MTEGRLKDMPYQIKDPNAEEARNTAKKMLIEGQERAVRASGHLENSAWAAATQAAVESMERSAKGIVALSLHQLPKTHRMTIEHNIACLKALQTRLLSSQRHLFVECARALLWAYTWASLLQISQWAFDEVPITTFELFRQWDAESARQYADRCTGVLRLLMVSQAFKEGLADKSE